MKNKRKVPKLVNQYKAKQRLYKEFSRTVESFLTNLLKKNSFKYQSVTSRNKSVDSLEEKLTGNPKLSRVKRLNEIDDLAGCRIIFYLESDIQRFINLIRGEFKFERHKMFYTPEAYNAFHLVVKLKKDKLALKKYSKYKTMKCEIQLTTVLFHAWSEMAHDMIYKPSEGISEFDQAAFKSLEKQFSDVMKNHIKQASASFEFINKQFDKIKQGKKVFDRDSLNAIIQSKSNNELYDNLKLLLDYVKEFGDKAPADLKLMKVLSAVVEHSIDIKVQPLKTIMGSLEGYTSSELLTVCLDILYQLKYIHPSEVIDLIIHIFHNSSPEVKNLALMQLGEVASYNLPVLKNAGYYYQDFILKYFEERSDEFLIKNFEILIKVANNLLQPSFEGHEMDSFKSMKIYYGSLDQLSFLKLDDLVIIRKGTINILKRLFHLLPRLSQKQRVLQILKEATISPRRGEYGEHFKSIIKENAREIAKFYLESLPKINLFLIKDIEEQSRWFENLFGEDKLPIITKIQKIIYSHSEYTIIKNLVGYDSAEEMSWDESDKERKKTIQKFISEISRKTFKKWQDRILFICNNYSECSPDKFLYFYHFLNELGKQKPQLAFKLIEQNEKQLEPFLKHLVAGIWKSKSPNIAKRIISTWVKKNKHVSTCAGIFLTVEEIDKRLLKMIFEKAVTNQDVAALNYIICLIASTYPKYKQINLLIDSIKELTKIKEPMGILFSNLPRNKLLLKSFKQKDWTIILENLLLIPKIDYHAEEILLGLIDQYPLLAIQFFYNRIIIQQKKQLPDRYESIPFQFHNINKALQKHSKLVVSEVLKWPNKKVFQWQVSRFLQVIFPNFNDDLEKQLILLIKNGKERDGKIVISILDSYTGQRFLHNACKEYVKKFPGKEKHEKQIFGILSKTGVVSGEYGFVGAYKEKIKEIQDWKNDDNKIIKSFTKKYEKFLNTRITFEQKLADEQIEGRKMRYDKIYSSV